VGLDRLVDHPLGHGRGSDLDGLDLGMRALVAHGVHHPRGLEHEQPGLLDAHPGFGDPVLDDPLLGQWLAERGPVGDPLAHQPERTFRRADEPHAVMDPARAEPGLGDRETVTFPGDQIGGRHPDVAELDLGMAAVRRVVVAEQGYPAPHIDAGSVPGHQDHGLLAVPVATLRGAAHHDEDRALGVHRPR
jgi:hypothetical protein